MIDKEFNIVTDISLIDSVSLEKFVSEHPNSNFFQTITSYKILKNKGHGIFIVCLDNENRIFGLIIGYAEFFGVSLLKKYIKRIVIIGGPLVKDNNIRIFNLLLEYLNLNYGNKFIYFEIRNIFITTFENIFLQNNYFYEPHLNIENDLSISIEEIYGRLSNSRKKGIKRAEKNGFTVKIKNNLNDFEIDLFYKLIKKSHNKLKIPFPKIEFFKGVNLEATSGRILYFLLKDKNEKIKAILLNFSYQDKMYGYILGYDYSNELLKNKPFDFLYWKVFQFAKHEGFISFNWMGAGKPNEEYGVRDFKLQFGGQLFESGRFIKVNNRFLFYLLNKILLKLYKLIK